MHSFGAWRIKSCSTKLFEVLVVQDQNPNCCRVKRHQNVSINVGLQVYTNAKIYSGKLFPMMSKRLYQKNTYTKSGKTKWAGPKAVGSEQRRQVGPCLLVVLVQRQMKGLWYSLVCKKKFIPWFVPACCSMLFKSVVDCSRVLDSISLKIREDT